jgi:hypothetical protein
MFSADNRSWRVVAAVVLGGLLSFTAACGGSDGGSGGSGDILSDGGSDNSPHVDVTVDITGDTTMKGSSTGGLPTNHGLDYDSCAKYAAGEDDDGAKELVMGQSLHEKIGDKLVLVGVKIKNYHGAGTYEKEDLSDVAGGAGIDLGGTLYLQYGDSVSTMTADGKGGGKWVFTDLTKGNPDGTRGSHNIAGTITFTCKDS